MVCLESVRDAQPLNCDILIRLHIENNKINTYVKLNSKINIDKHEKDPAQG